MAKEIHKEVGHGLDGSMRFTLGIIAGLLMIIGGIGLMIYGNFYILGVPLVILGLILPILMQLALSKGSV